MSNRFNWTSTLKVIGSSLSDNRRKALAGALLSAISLVGSPAQASAATAHHPAGHHRFVTDGHAMTDALTAAGVPKSSVFHGQVKTAAEARLARNSVFLVARNNAMANGEDPVGLTTFFGTGTVVANSAEDVGDGAPAALRIVTAGHVAVPSTAEKEDPLAKSILGFDGPVVFNGDVDVFNSSGVKIGEARLMATSGDTMAERNIAKRDKADVAVLEMTSVTPEYQKLDGVPLSRNISSEPLTTAAPMNFAMVGGASGSGLVDAQGGLVGVTAASDAYGRVGISTNLDIIESQKAKGVDMATIKPRSDLAKMVVNMIEASERAFPTASNVDFSPLGNSNILAALGPAGREVRPLDQAPDLQDLQVYAFPNLLGVHYHIDAVRQRHADDPELVKETYRTESGVDDIGRPTVRAARAEHRAHPELEHGTLRIQEFRAQLAERQQALATRQQASFEQPESPSSSAPKPF